MEATASIVGIVSFGLGLAKSLQTFVESVIEAEETIILIVAEVNATASTLKRLQDFIEQDKAASEEQNRAAVFNDIGLKEIGACAQQCQKIYVQIIVLIEKASIQDGAEGGKDVQPQAPAAGDSNAASVRLAVFSKNVTKLGRKMRWPWLEPRIKRCQEHLGRLKISLMLSLQVFSIAESRSHHFVATVLGTEDEDEMIAKAEALRKKIAELQAKKPTQRPSNRPPPGSTEGPREVPDPAASTSDVSTASRRTSRSVGWLEYGDDPDNLNTSSSYLGSDRPRRPRGSRRVRAVRVLRALKAHVRKKTERKSVFKKDFMSTVFEAYMIHSTSRYLGPFPGNNNAPTPIKLPFGHRRLKREVKRALRRCNPWDILLWLSSSDRDLVDRVVQQAHVGASTNMSVCLVAVDVDGYSDADLAVMETDSIHWSRMVLFFRLDPARIDEGATDLEQYAVAGRPRFTAKVRNMFRSSQRRNVKHKQLQEKIKLEKEERERQQAKTEADREDVEKAKAEIEEIKKALEVARIRIEEDEGKLETEKTRIAEERDAMESKDRALKNAEQAVLRSIERGTAKKELKEVFEEERTKRMIEEEQIRKKMAEELARKRMHEEYARKEAMERAEKEKLAYEAKKMAEKAKPPVKFKDAVGRKFNFPFHLVQTWQGMEELIKQAFLHVDAIGPHVMEGHYDLVDSEGQVILPSTWAETIKPGAFVTMHMWPMKDQPPPPPPPRPAPLFPGMPMQPSPFPGMPGVPGMPPDPASLTAPRPPGFPPVNPQPLFGGSVRPPPPPPRMSEPIIIEERRPSRRAKKAKPAPRRGAARKKTTREGEAVVLEDIYSGELSEDIDKELGLDDLEIPEQMASKDIDELLAAWTNPSSDGNER